MNNPQQPIVKSSDGVMHFKCNAIVRYLLETNRDGLNKLALMGFSQDDWDQFMQLLGYSVSGFLELSRVSDEAKERVKGEWEWLKE